MHTSTLPRPPGSAPSGPAATWPRRSTPRPSPARRRWARPALLALLVGTAVLYLWGLSASGYANDFYAAAVHAGTQSWKAWLFGSLDSGNAITVDKPPAALWVMALSARIFGFSSWSLLVPQALMGVASVALLHAAVRRWAGPVAGLPGRRALALTPAAVLMFRFDNPDALLTLLLVTGRTRRCGRSTPSPSRLDLVAGRRRAAVGFGFLTKMGQALLVVPAFGLAYLVAGPPRLRTRLVQLLAALVSMVVSAGWLIALVELWPADSRPYIGGSTTNSLLELALGYNGLGRILGGSGTAGVAAGAATPGSAASPASCGCSPTSWASRSPGCCPRRSSRSSRWSWSPGAGRTGRTACGRRRCCGAAGRWSRPGLQLHERDDAPVLHGGPRAGDRRAGGHRVAPRCGLAGQSLAARAALALMVAATAAWSSVLLAGSTESFAWVRWVVVGLAVPAVAGLLVGAGRLRRAALVGVVAALLTGLAGSGAYAVATASVAHTGSIPSVGTTSSAMGGGPGGGAPSGDRPAGAGRTRATDAGAPPQGMGGGMGVSTNSELTALLTATDGTWSAAVSTSQTAASLELATGTAVMSTGGWGGSDSAVTLEQFQADVASGQISYYVGGGQGGGPGGDSDSTSSQIAEWVAANYTATTVGGQTVYDLQS